MKSKMKTILCITFLFIHFILNGDCNTFGFLDEDDMFKCYYHLLCDLNKVEEYQETVEKSGPQAVERHWKYIQMATGFTGSGNTVEGWSKYRTFVCDDPEEEKKRKFEDYFKLCLEYWLEACIVRISPRCKEAERAAMVLADYFKGHMKNGDCKKEN